MGLDSHTLPVFVHFSRSPFSRIPTIDHLGITLEPLGDSPVYPFYLDDGDERVHLF